VTCYPCSQGRSEDCKHLGLCPAWCCPVDDDVEDDE